MNKRLQNGKLRRLRIHLKDMYAFTIKDIMKLLRVEQQTATYYRNKLLDEGFIDVSHGTNREVFFKVIRKKNEDQKPTHVV